MTRFYYRFRGQYRLLRYMDMPPLRAAWLALRLTL